MKCFVHAALRCTGLALVALLCVGGDVRAQVTYGVSYPYLGSSGVSVGGVSAEAFNVWNATTGSSTSGNFPAFCIDLWHTEGTNNFSAVASTLGASGALSNTSQTVGPQGTGSLTESSLTASGLSAQLSYLGYVFNQIESVTKAGSGNQDSNALAAVQASLWVAVDKYFSATNWGNTTASGDYTSIQGGVTGSANTYWTYIGTSGSSVKIYSESTTGLAIPTATILQVNDGPGTGANNGTSNYQNLITWGATPQVSGTPEPSSLAIAGIGALAFAGYGLRRRRAGRIASVTCECDAGEAAAGIAS